MMGNGGWHGIWNRRSWRSPAAFLLALGFSTTAGLPLLLARSAGAEVGDRSVDRSIGRSMVLAQLFSNPSSQVRITAGNLVPVRYEDAEKIVVLPDETAPVTLSVATAIRTARGTVIIPQGSLIEGELRPIYAEDDDEEPVGTQFVAETLVFPSGVRQSVDAVSDVITETETITRRSDPDILRGAAIGAAAAAVLAEILGDIDFIEVLAGAGLGALASVLLRGREEVDVVVIYPETDLDLTLQSDFVLGAE